MEETEVKVLGHEPYHHLENPWNAMLTWSVATIKSCFFLLSVKASRMHAELLREEKWTVEKKT